MITKFLYATKATCSIHVTKTECWVVIVVGIHVAVVYHTA